MEKLKMHSPNFTDENIAKLAALFPGCVTESTDEDGNLQKSIDFDQLKQELSAHIVEGPRERYHLNWPGKQDALLTANAPIAKTLRPCRDDSVDFDITENLFVEGDNLDALKLLQETYLGKVKMIYIDPPYNTGSDLIYEDDFAHSTEEYLLNSGQKDEEGNRLIANTDSNGRFHSDWLSMMYSRLKLARNLLRDDGVIFISIDDCEADNLKKICLETFGESNFIAQLVWEKGRKNDAKRFSVGHDYILCFAKEIATIEQISAPWREPKSGVKEIIEEYNKLKLEHGDSYEDISAGLVTFYKNLPKGHPSKAYSRSRFVDQRGIWRDNNISWPGGGGPMYDVLHPVTKEPCKVPDDGWKFIEKTMEERIRDKYVEFRADHTQSPFYKSYLYIDPESTLPNLDETSGVKKQVMGSVFYRHTQPSNDVIKDLFGKKLFNNPKDHEILGRLINYCTSNNDLVCDFFSGSSATAHAVMQLNAEDGLGRKFIMVQLPEECDEKSEAFKAGYKTIAEIGKERIRRAGKKIKDESPITTQQLDTGFRVLKVDSSNMADIYYTPDSVDQKQLSLLTDNIKADRTSEDLLFQVLLDWGVDLTLPITRETIDNREVFFVDNNALAACFVKNGQVTEDFCKELAKHQPLRVVFRDSGFKDDSIKINVEQIFKLMSPHTEVKCI